MHTFTKLILKTLLLAAGVFFYTSANAGFVHLNDAGGVSTIDGLHFIIDDSSQLQVVRNKGGQVFEATVTPDIDYNRTFSGNRRTDPLYRLDNGIYIRGNSKIYGPKHFANSATSLVSTYTSASIVGPTPATAARGIPQTATTNITVPHTVAAQRPIVTVTWSYIYPFDFITANVEVFIPASYPVSATNQVRYYHVVDTYLGGSDSGCGVRYVDVNNKQVVGTYPRTNGGCPSGTGLPAGLDVVETFRERDGPGFSHYCVGYYEFWGEGGSSTDCNITIPNTTSPNTLNDTVSRTFKDTGMAIEYDFSAPGLYKFSYDFVVGSTAVPAYDHLEVRHPGTSSLCPANVQVLACLSSTVPCPESQMIYSGKLTGDLTLTPGVPAVSKSPNQQFDIGSNGPVWTYAVQGTSAGVYTFGYSGVNVTPLNGLKCWNTSTNSQSCSLAFNNTPCLTTFECMESGLTYNNLILTPILRNPIYTKLAGKGFDLDVYALTTGGLRAAGYTGNNVTVELVNENDSNGCGTTVLSKTVSFQSSDAGKKTVSFTDAEVSLASPALRCRVTDTTLNKTGCSTDNFTLRPQSLIVKSDNADVTATPVATSTKVFKASSGNFNLTAVGATGSGVEVNGYNGTPQIRSPNPVLAHTGAVKVGTISGVFSTNIGNSFTYSEVGYFKFNSNMVYDDTFSAVDSPILKGDCDNTNNPYDNVGVGTPKKYGCRVQNTVESSYFGRFIPDHFKVVGNSPVINGCGGFAYFDQDPSVITPFTATAENGANATTQNYVGNYARLLLTDYIKYNFAVNTTPSLNGSTLSPGTNNPITKILDNTLPVWNNGVAEVKVKHKLSRPVAPINKQNVSITTKPVDDDGVTSTLPAVLTDNVEFRYGRLAVMPAHGSELLPLSVPMEAQYYKDGIYVRSGGDSCTTVDPRSITMKNYKGNLGACETYISSVTTMSNGISNVVLAAPKIGTDGKPNTGSVDLEINLSSASGEQMCQSSGSPVSAILADRPWFGTVEPNARASFGIYKAPIIYMRENF